MNIWQQCLIEIERCADVAITQHGYEREMIIAFAEACGEKEISVGDGIDIIRKMAEMEGLDND